MKKPKFEYLVVGWYMNHDHELLCKCLYLDDARFEAAYQCKFFDKVTIQYKDKIVVIFKKNKGKIEEVEPDGE